MYWDERVGAARFVVSDRTGGVSAPPYDGLNLAQHVGDDAASVAANRATFGAVLDVGVRVVYVDQVHGDTVVEVEGPFDARPDAAQQADAMVTRLRGVALAILVADCVPVLLADPAAGVVAAAHAGRKGMLAGLPRTLALAMRERGATDIVARLGPSVCARCYPVPSAMRDEAAAQYPEASCLDRHGQPAIDVSAGVLAQLAPLCSDIQQLPGCSAEEPTLYSYRRDGVTGRFAGAVVLEAA